MSHFLVLLAADEEAAVRFLDFVVDDVREALEPAGRVYTCTRKQQRGIKPHSGKEKAAAVINRCAQMLLVWESNGE